MSFVRKFLRIGILVSVGLVMSGCFIFSLFGGGPSVDLGKNEWKIVSFVNSGVDYEPKGYEEIPQIRFDTKELKLYGNAGCNSFFASYAWVDDRVDEKTKKTKPVIEVRNSGMTRKLCESQEAMRFEQKLMEEFDGEFDVIVEGENLILKKTQLELLLAPIPQEQTQEQEGTQEENPS